MFSERAFSGLRYLFVIASTLVFLVATRPPQEAAARSAALEKVIEEAKKEKLLKLLWTKGHFGGDTGIQAILDAMNQRYGTNVSLQFTQGGSFPANLGRLTQEYRAKQPSSTDVFLGSAGHMVSGLQSGWLEKVDWDALLERPAPSNPVLPRVNPEGVGMAVASQVVGIVYNTNLVKGDDVPKSMEDVLKPKFKGQIATTPYVTGFYQFSAPDVLGIEFMRGFAQRLAPYLGGKIGCNSLDAVASGQFAMLIFDCGLDATIRYQRRGAPLAHVVPFVEIGWVPKVKSTIIGPGEVESPLGAHRCAVPPSCQVGSLVTLAIRPQHLTLLHSPEANHQAVEGKVMSKTYLGDAVLFEVGVSSVTLIVKLPGDFGFAVGQRAAVVLPEDLWRVYP